MACLLDEHNILMNSSDDIRLGGCAISKGRSKAMNPDKERLRKIDLCFIMNDFAWSSYLHWDAKTPTLPNKILSISFVD